MPTNKYLPNGSSGKHHKVGMARLYQLIMRTELRGYARLENKVDGDPPGITMGHEAHIHAQAKSAPVDINIACRQPRRKEGRCTCAPLMSERDVFARRDAWWT